MDTRVQKTRQNLFNAFLKLRSEQPLEKITIKELTDTAGISKQTFYLHYKDIFDLADSIENELVTDICSVLNDIDDILGNIGHAAGAIFKRVMLQDSTFRIIFSGSRASSLTFGIVRELKKVVYQQRPELRADLNTNIYLSTLVHGIYNSYQEYKSIDQEKVIKILRDIAHYMSEGYNSNFKH
ncbi:MAG: TetR/AcrR family transcriptional regulator [Lachnospiraceae bacterium]|nr:TetR/AcrR family transcriptional regulator [Lachnospiraceae bacterium]